MYFFPFDKIQSLYVKRKTKQEVERWGTGSDERERPEGGGYQGEGKVHERSRSQIRGEMVLVKKSKICWTIVMSQVDQPQLLLLPLSI